MSLMNITYYSYGAFHSIDIVLMQKFLHQKNLTTNVCNCFKIIKMINLLWYYVSISISVYAIFYPRCLDLGKGLNINIKYQKNEYTLII